MSFIKKNKYAFIQLLIVIVLTTIVLVVSSVSYNGGSINEKARFSADSSSPDYFMKSLNSSDVTFAIPMGYNYEDVIAKYFPNASYTLVDSWSDMVARVSTGADDAFFIELGSVQDYVDAYPTLYAFGDSFAASEYNLITAKSDAGVKLAEQLNAYTASIRKSGAYDVLNQKWMYGSDEDRVLDEVEFAEDAVPLHICVDADWKPFSYMSDPEEGYKGLYIDYFNEFCAANGYIPDYSMLSGVDSCIMGLSSGVYDVAAMGLGYSEDRAKTVTFTDPVGGDATVIMVRKSSVEGLNSGSVVGGFFASIQASIYNNVIAENRWQLLLSGLLNTLYISLASMLLGTLLGGLIYFLRSRKNAFVSSIGRLYITIFERMPQLLLLLTLFYIVFAGADIPAIGICVVAFSLSFAAYVAEMIRSGIEAVPVGQSEAALALGYTKFGTFRKVVLPQMIRNVLPVYKGQVVMLILDTSIAGYIAVQDLTRASDIIRANTLEAVIPMLISAILYFLLTTIIMLLITQIEKRISLEQRPREPKWVKQLEAGEND